MKKILIVHNHYAQKGRGSGEEVSLNNIERLLKENGYSVFRFSRYSNNIISLRDKISGFFTGVYNPFIRRKFRKKIFDIRPDVILIQNLYPIISPSILSICKSKKILLLMRCPNYRLICPNGLLLSHGNICERCIGGKEYWCIIRNCENNVFKSIGYALRNTVGRLFKLYANNVDKYLVLTDFAKNKLIDAGFNKEKIEIIYSMPDFGVKGVKSNEKVNNYVGYVGRFSLEKGIKELIETVEKCPDIPFKFAGGREKDINIIKSIPKNLEIVGRLNQKSLSEFYQKARFIVIPSKWYEGLPVVALEAMVNEKAIVCSNLGGLSEIVEDMKNGILFDPFRKGALTEAVSMLWNDESTCINMGKEGAEMVRQKFSRKVYYQRINEIIHSSSNFPVRSSHDKI